MSQSLSPFLFNATLPEPTGFFPQTFGMDLEGLHEPYIFTTGTHGNNDSHVHDAGAADSCSALSSIEFPFEEFIDTETDCNDAATQDCLSDPVVKEQQFIHIAPRLETQGHDKCQHLPTPSETPPTPSHNAVAAEASLMNPFRNKVSDCDIANDSESTPESANTSHSHPLRRLDNVLDKLKKIRTSLMGLEKRKRSESFKEHGSISSAQHTIKRQLTGCADRARRHSDDEFSLLSWKTDKDPNSEWFTQLREWIGSLSEKPRPHYQQCIFTTPCLPLMERIKVHYIANSHRLHHMSAGKDRQSKFVVVSPFKLVPRAPKDPTSMIEPFVDLSTLWVQCEEHALCLSSSCDDFQEMICSNRRSEVPKPVDVQGVTIGKAGFGVNSAILCLKKHRGVRCRYRSWEEAALVRSRVAAVQIQVTDNYHRSVKLNADYAVQVDLYDEVPLVASSNYAILTEFHGIAPFGSAWGRLPFDRYLAGEVLRDVNRRSGSGKRNDTFPTASLHRDSQSIHSAESRCSDASRRSMTSNMSQLSFASNRTRSERIENGYECVDCHKMFDRQCDRDKHWKNTHGPRTHVCQFCEHGFVLEKDLTRHLKSMHGGGESL